MTTAYTSLLGLALPVTGELQGTWGDTVNNSITSLLDAAVAGTTTLSTDGDVTLTTTTGASNQARQAILLCSGARTAVRTVTAPAQSKIYTVINATTGGYAVKIVGAGPTTGVTIPAGQTAQVAWNGSDFVDASNYFNGNLKVNGNLTVSGATALNGNMTFGDASADTVTVNGTITSNLIFTDNTYDIGASGATRPRRIYVGTSVNTPTAYTSQTYAANGLFVYRAGDTSSAGLVWWKIGTWIPNVSGNAIEITMYGSQGFSSGSAISGKTTILMRRDNASNTVGNWWFEGIKSATGPSGVAVSSSTGDVYVLINSFYQLQSNAIYVDGDAWTTSYVSTASGTQPASTTLLSNNVQFGNYPTLFIDAANNSVSIGSSDTSTGAALQVNGSDIFVKGSAVNTAISLQSVGGSGRKYSLVSTTGGQWTVYDGTAVADRITVNSNGYVRIGQGTPSAQLEVYGQSGLRLTNSSSLKYGDIYLDTGTGFLAYNTGGAYDHRFYTNSVFAMSIDSNQRVGINMTNQSSYSVNGLAPRLAVYGDTLTTGVTQTTLIQQGFGIPDSGGNTTTYAKLGRWYTNQAGYILHIRVCFHVGFNASSAQNGIADVYIKTGNGSSYQVVSGGNFYGDGNYFQLGPTSLQNVLVTQVDTSTYDVYLAMGNYSNGSYYTIDMTPGTSWVNAGTSSTSAPTGVVLTLPKYTITTT